MMFGCWTGGASVLTLTCGEECVFDCVHVTVWLTDGAGIGVLRNPPLCGRASRLAWWRAPCRSRRACRISSSAFPAARTRLLSPLAGVWSFPAL
jgi:hypothetical protein